MEVGIHHQDGQQSQQKEETETTGTHELSHFDKH
jgi:hypothetical protein